MDDEDIDIYVPVEGSAEIRDVPCREEKKTRKHGLLKVYKCLTFCLKNNGMSNSRNQHTALSPLRCSFFF